MHPVADTGLTEEYLTRLRAEQKTLTEKLINGHPKDYAEYTKISGRILGMKEAERILHETIKMYMEMQDVDDF